MSTIRFGIDHVLEAPELLQGSIGLVTNDAARPARDPNVRSRVALRNAGCRVSRLFSPEHGISANAPDGARVPHSLDTLTDLPVTSLYGDTLRPAHEMFTKLDTIVFDIPDIGARFYTYVWTMSYVLETCAEVGVPLVVLDRPNPLGGDMSAAEGPLLDVEHCASFLGRAAIPIRHSLTIGELARLLNIEWRLHAKLEVIRCAGWTRAQHWPDTGLPFIPTSPAMPDYFSALAYPGTCLFEATNLSVGRGTDFPFQLIGAPWLDAQHVAREFNSLALKGVIADCCAFVPAQEPHAGANCHAVRFTLTEPKRFRPVAAGLHLLEIVVRTHRRHFRWQNYPTRANPKGEDHFARLIGRADIRDALGTDHTDICHRISDWTDTRAWTALVRDILLYD